jgi:Fe/S biogenesis protein NfuA
VLAVEEVIRVTPAALEVVREVRAGEPDPEGLGLFLEVNGSANGAYTYDLWFGSKSKITPGDHRQLAGDITIVVPGQSVERLRGAVLDVNPVAGEAGLVIINANTPPRPSDGAVEMGDLTGPVAQRVIEVLDRDVNPQIAMHGGHVSLVGVQGSTAYVEMSGGCQGCGMARATLSQGIAVAITDAVEEISEVVDVTDHMSGLSPYFAPGPA